MSAKKFTTVNMGELFKRVPPNQMEQFKKFRDLTSDYRRRANKYPDKLPAIDWEYYRTNVREDDVKLVEQYQVKYEELNRSFAKRHEVLDHTKYYTEWEELNAKVHYEVEKFIEDSELRIQVIEEEIKRIKDLKYENMTIEEFVKMREDRADFIPGPGKDTFWPHNPEEQLGYAEPMDGEGEETDEAPKEK